MERLLNTNLDTVSAQNADKVAQGSYLCCQFDEQCSENPIKVFLHVE